MLEIASRKHSADIFSQQYMTNKADKNLSFSSCVFELQQYDQMTIMNWLFYKSKAVDAFQMLEMNELKGGKAY